MTLFGTIRNSPSLVRSLVARQVISCTCAFATADLHPLADAERLLDLNREPGEQVAERVLQREADHDRADGRRRQQLLAQQHRADHDEQHDDGEVLDDRREAIGGAILAATDWRSARPRR